MECAVCGLTLIRGTCPLHGIGAHQVEPIESVRRRPVASVRRITDLSLVAGVSTTMNFLSSAEVDDTDGMWIPSATTSQLTAKTSGYYLLCGSASFAANATGTRSVWVEVADMTVAKTQMQGHAGSNNVLSTSGVALIQAGDAITLVVLSISAALDCLAGSGSSHAAPRLSAALLRYP
jgi:hypothetical protein